MSALLAHSATGGGAPGPHTYVTIAEGMYLPAAPAEQTGAIVHQADGIYFISMRQGGPGLDQWTFSHWIDGAPIVTDQVQTSWLGATLDSTPGNHQVVAETRDVLGGVTPWARAWTIPG